MSRLIKLEFASDLARISLNRPDALNALSTTLMEELEQAIHQVEGSNARALIITGTGRAFCVGGDLHDFRAALSSSTESLMIQLERNQRILFALEDLKIPTIAAINGICIAGGLELALCCDLIYAARSSVIGDGHARFGILPGGGATARLTRRISASRAKLMMFTGDLYAAEVMRQWGLVDEVCDDRELESAVLQLASKMGSRSSLLLSHMKTLLDANVDRTVQEGNAAEMASFRAYAASPDLQEGLTAFQDKRSPSYRSG